MCPQDHSNVRAYHVWKKETWIWNMPCCCREILVLRHICLSKWHRRLASLSFYIVPQLISARQYHFRLNCAMKHEALFSWLESQSNYLLSAVCVCVCVGVCLSVCVCVCVCHSLSNYTFHFECKCVFVCVQTRMIVKEWCVLDTAHVFVCVCVCVCVWPSLWRGTCMFHF